MAKSFKELMNEYDLEKAVDLFKKNYSQFMYRLYKRIENMFNHYNYNYFATLTLNEDNISIKEKTLIRYGKEFLNNYIDVKDFVCNVDYGEDNNRMHLHCMLSSDVKINYSLMIKEWGRGAIKNKVITKKNKYKIGRYITKIGNHAAKGSANNVFRKKIKYSKQRFEVKRIKYQMFKMNKKGENKNV